MAVVIRRLVSKQRRRFQDGGFDLDLAYITPRIIAMGLPAEGKEVVYRNPMDEVARFITRYHVGHCRVYNLCAERCYESDRLAGNVVCYPLQDHQAAPLHVIAAFCTDADAYLSADARNVVAVHCKAGKGRTGTLICSLLAFQGICPDAEAAMDLYGEMRTHNRRGLTLPSQRRYVHYFTRCLKAGSLPPAQPVLRVAGLHLSGLPAAVLAECVIVLYLRPDGQVEPRPLVVLVAKGSTRKLAGKRWRRVEHSPLLQVCGQHASADFSPMHGKDGGAGGCVAGDLKVQVFHGAPKRGNSLFYSWLHPALLDEGRTFTAVRWQLDRVKSRVPDGVLLELHFEVAPPEAAAAAAVLAAAGGAAPGAATSEEGSERGGAGGARLQSFDVEIAAARGGGGQRRDGDAADPFLRASSAAPDEERRRRGAAAETGEEGGRGEGGGS